jgi:phosphotransferase system  glucose/maltose/N-acetylglucosamine-specific IIC component
MNEPTPGTDGKNHLFRDSKLGVWVTGLLGIGTTAVLDGVIDELSNVDTSGWSGWWVPVVGTGIATAVGLLTAYKARRSARAGRL